MREVKNMYLDLAKELKRNTKLMEHTFEKFNLQVLQFTYRPCSDNDADCKLIIELETIDEEMMEDDASIKVNLYDENGEIILTQECFIDSEEFDAYDTFELSLYNNSRTLIEAKSARIFMSNYICLFDYLFISS